MHPSSRRTVKSQFRYPEVLLTHPKKMSHHTVNWISRLHLPTFNLFEHTKVIHINLSSQQLELPITEKNKSRLTAFQQLLQLLDVKILQRVSSLVPDPPFHLLFIESAVVVLPISAPDLSIDRERWMIAIQLELVSRNIQKLKPLE